MTDMMACMNYHINWLLLEWKQTKGDVNWIVLYDKETGEYKSYATRLHALHVIDHMRIHNLEEFMGFTLERWPNSFWLKKKDE
jgi:hypothetical protein